MAPLGSAIVSDIRGRLPLYLSDWRDGFNKRALSATLFIFFTNILPALTFANFLANRTRNALGVVETVLSMGIGGTLFALLAGQPLVIVGVTGPISILCATIYDLAAQFGIPFFGWLAWICIWACAMHLALAVGNTCEFVVRYATPFSGEVFGALIALIYCYEGVLGFVHVFEGGGAGGTGASSAPASLPAALLSLLLGLGHFALAFTSAGARGWTILPKGARALTADYLPSLSILIFTAARYLPRFHAIALPSLQVPSSFGPSTAGRPWCDADAIASTPAWAIFAAALPAAVLTILLFFDHNISAMLSQRPEFGLRKPPSYNYDFALLGVSVLVTGLLGLPPNYGLIPQAPLHVRSLAKIREVQDGPLKREVWVRVCETRVSALGQSLLTLALLSPPLLAAMGAIPAGVLSGLFLHLGLSGLAGMSLTERVHYMLMDAASRSGVARPWSRLRLRSLLSFTGLQLLLVLVIFLITLTQAGIIFPVLIVLLIPCRLYLLPRLYSNAALSSLDPRESTPAEPEPEPLAG